MKTKVLYETDDGSTFSTIEDAEKYDILCHKVAKLMSFLPTRGARDFVTHNIQVLLSIRNQFLNLAEEYISGFADSFARAREQREHNQTFVGRIIDDSGVRVLYSTWVRFMSMSMKTGKEYEQPYYAINE